MDLFSPIKESDVLLRYLAKETDEKENEMVHQWLEQSPENVSYFNHLKHLWDDQENHASLHEKYETLKAWDKLNDTLSTTAHPSNRWKKRYIWFAAAASVIMFVCVGYFLISNNRSDKELKEIAGNSVRKIILPDKSVVWLNCNSELNYRENFIKNRKITLSGEGYFEVKPDQSHPFEVYTATARIKVLGTKFNVKAYPGDAQTEVSVTSGKVSFTPQFNHMDRGKELILTSSEKGISMADSVTPQKAELNNPNYMSWKTHEFVLNNTNIKDIVNIIRSTYHVDVVLQAQNTKNCNLSGKFTDQSLDEILDMLQVAFKVTYEKENNTIIIKKTDCQ
ncbi:MAG TPA: FecR family protein [Bacteroidales bacterium]